MLTFLNPGVLWWGAAATIPLFLHLLKRRQTVRIRFSTLRFLKMAQKQSSRRMRLENFLLWLLRTAILLLIAMAFALPILRTRSFSGLLGRSNRDVAIVWDVSYSMAYETGPRHIWEESRETVLAILRGLRRGDRVSILLADEDVTPLVGEPTEELDLVAAQVKAQAWRPTTSRLLPAVGAAVKTLGASPRKEKELYIVTDGQALPWQGFAGGGGTSTNAAGVWNPAALPSDLPFFVVLSGATAPANATPLDVTIEPPLLMADAPSSAAVKFGRFGAARDNTLALFVDGREVTRQTVTGAEASDTRFQLPPLPAGVHAARVQSEADGLAPDNELHFLLRVKDRLPVFVAAPESDSFFLRRALDPGGRKALDVVVATPDAVPVGDLTKYACVFLANAAPVPGQLLLSLESYVRQGGLAVFFPGDLGGPADYASVGILPAKPERIIDADRDAGRLLLRLVQAQDPIFSTLKFPPGSVPAVTLRRRMAWGAMEPGGEAIVMTQGELPFLLSRTVGRGRVLAFSVSAERGWSDFPLSPFYVPLLHQIVHFGAGVARDPLYVRAARDLPLENFVPETEEVALRGPAGQPVPVRRVKSEQSLGWHVENVYDPGVYTLPDARSTPLIAVNTDRAESDLTPAQDGDIARWLRVEKLNVARDAVELGRLVESSRTGRPLAEALLWAVLILSLAEVFLSNRASRASRPLTERLRVDLSGRMGARVES